MNTMQCLRIDRFIPRVVLAAAIFTSLLSAQSAGRDSCGNVLAVLPTSTDLLYSRPVVGGETRERFELRECGSLYVYAFNEGKRSPSLVMNTHEAYPLHLYHFGRILAFQAVGGSADHIYIFAFEGGTPRLVTQTATKGIMHPEFSRDGDAVTFVIPSSALIGNPEQPPKRMKLSLP